MTRCLCLRRRFGHTAHPPAHTHVPPGWRTGGRRPQAPAGRPSGMKCKGGREERGGKNERDARVRRSAKETGVGASAVGSPTTTSNLSWPSFTSAAPKQPCPPPPSSDARRAPRPPCARSAARLRLAGRASSRPVSFCFVLFAPDDGALFFIGAVPTPAPSHTHARSPAAAWPCQVHAAQRSSLNVTHRPRPNIKSRTALRRRGCVVGRCCRAVVHAAARRQLWSGPGKGGACWF